MNPHVADRLSATIAKTDSIACVGLDPRVNLLPPELIAQAKAQDVSPREQVAWAFEQFGRGILQAVAGACAAVKPQIACYEAYGAAGMAALERLISYANELAIPVIADAKRGDIGSTATHYGEAWLGSAAGLDGERITGADADWLTVNGYLGSDGVFPMLPPQDSSDKQAGVFVLVKTSNPSSSELQNLSCEVPGNESAQVMTAMAQLVNNWGADRLGNCGLSSIGAVVGATWPQEARDLRQRMPDTLFLVPGYGAQGGTAADALAGRRDDGQGVLINSSRGIIGAWQKTDTDDFATAARTALDAMNADLRSAS